MDSARRVVFLYACLLNHCYIKLVHQFLERTKQQQQQIVGKNFSCLVFLFVVRSALLKIKTTTYRETFPRYLSSLELPANIR